MLEREFDQGDLARMRNLIAKKYNDATRIIGRRQSAETERREGSVWTENGKQWTLQNGHIVAVSKTRSVRDKLQTGVFCPGCQKPLAHEHDRRMITLRGVCLDCVTKAETDLKISGQYAEYERQHVSANLSSWVKEAEAELAEIFGQPVHLTSPGTMTEDGEEENWAGGGELTDLKQQLQAGIEVLKQAAETVQAPA